MTVAIGRLVVCFFDPDWIKDFLTAHPCVWYDKELARPGALGDQAGRTPTPVVAEFHRWVATYGLLPTQQEFIEFCFDQWEGWPATKYIGGVQAKVGRNFYPSLIDTYHAFGLVAKAGWYQRCSMDSVEDTVGKADLTLAGDGYAVRVNLKGPWSKVSDEAERWKILHRGHGIDVVQIRMPKRDMGAGNKRWYELGDFRVIQPSLFGGER